jgi:hypothetical protein
MPSLEFQCKTLRRELQLLIPQLLDSTRKLHTRHCRATDCKVHVVPWTIMDVHGHKWTLQAVARQSNAEVGGSA